MLKLKTKKETYSIDVFDENGVNVLATFYMQPLTPEEMDSLGKKHTKVKYESPGRGQTKQRVEDVNYYAIAIDRIRRVFVGWEGIYDESGEEIPFSPENAIAIFQHNPSVINDALTKMDDIVNNEYKLAEEKKQD